jgi:hypothetical protein
MGLDIMAYSKLQPVSAAPSDPDEQYEQGYVHAFAYSAFPRSTRGLRNGGDVHPISDTSTTMIIAESWYKTTADTETIGFRAGSYSGYGFFRGLLASLVGTTPEAMWDDPGAVDQPFYELIHFADNEGCIGPEAARDLLADFREHRDAWAQMVKANADLAGAVDYYIDKYDEWIRAFELASDGGLVEFG